MDDVEYIELIFKKFDIEGWRFLQTNPNGTHTFQCISCKCALALPGLDDIANYSYCPSCAKDMRKHRGGCMLDEDCICYLENISKLFERGKENCSGDALELQQKHIDALQYAIKELRKNERPQGKWIEYDTACHHYKCNQCNADYNRFMVKPNFCPNCGTAMR